MALIETPELANRLARAIAQDIELYNKAKVVAGIQNDNLFEGMKDELAEGRELYRSRIAPELYNRTNFFDRAVVDVLLRPNGTIKSKIW